MSPFLRIGEHYLNRDLIGCISFRKDGVTIHCTQGRVEFKGAEMEALRAHLDADAIDLMAPKPAPDPAWNPQYIWATSHRPDGKILARGPESGTIMHVPISNLMDPGVLRFDSLSAASAWFAGLSPSVQKWLNDDGFIMHPLYGLAQARNPQGTTP